MITIFFFFIFIENHKKTPHYPQPPTHPKRQRDRETDRQTERWCKKKKKNSQDRQGGCETSFRFDHPPACLPSPLLKLKLIS